MSGSMSPTLPGSAHSITAMPEIFEILTDLEDPLSLNDAASHSRFPPDKLTEQEAGCFPDVVAGHSAACKRYLYLRNSILQLWLNNAREELTFERIVESVPWPYNGDKPLIYRIHSFLNRYGFINFGVFRLIAAPAASKFRVIVIGAGAAGLMAARQLTRFGFDVTILEARVRLELFWFTKEEVRPICRTPTAKVFVGKANRIGGRIATFKRNDFIGDLGAMVVLGLCGGNPLAALARQIPMELRKIRQSSPTYAQDGTRIDKATDDMVQMEFNNLLKAISYMAHSRDLSRIGDRPLSVGDAMDLALIVQEKRVRDTRLEYLKTVLEFQAKLKQCLHKLRLWKKCVERLSDEFQRELASARSTNLFQSYGAANSESVNVAFVLRRLHLRSKRRDLTEALQKYGRLLEYRDKIEEEIRSLEGERPSETYMNREERQLLDWHIAYLEFANAAPLNKVSLEHHDQDSAYDFSDGTTVRVDLNVRNGYAIVPVHLAKDLAIRLKMAVKEIHYGPNGVRVLALTDDGGSEAQSETFEADAVLCTLPLGVLKHSLTAPENDATAVSFHPPLPDWKQTAIRNLGFGNLNKVVLCFDTVFWEPEVSFFGCVGEVGIATRGEFYQFWNLYDAPVLIGLLAGESADLSEQIDENVLVGRCMRILRGIFGPTVPQTPKDFLVTRWRKDPWSRGSYSFVSTDSSGEDYDLLAAPVNSTADGERHRLFFAGEHTCRNYPATVHGAIFSGLREAGRLADAYLGYCHTPDAVPAALQPPSRVP